MPPNAPDRRRAVRRSPEPDETLSRVRLRTGRDLTVVDISASGALVEGLTRLLPNTHTDVHIVTRHGRVLVRSRITRAFVWRLERDIVCYRTALAFDTSVDIESSAPSDQSQSRLAASNGPGLKASGLSERSESNGLALSGRSESNGYLVPDEIPGHQADSGIAYPGQPR